MPLVAGVATLATGALVLVAWALGLSAVKHVAPGLPDMKANTSIALLGLGSALLALREGMSLGRQRAGRIVALLVSVLGAVVLLEYLVVPLGIDELLFDDAGTAPGRPAPHTALALLLLGGALATAGCSRRWRHAREWLLGAGAAVVLSALVGYAYGVDFVRATTGTTGMALHTTLALAAVAVGIAFLRPDRGLVGYLRGQDPGAATARRLLPAIVVLPLVMGFAHLAGERLGLDAAVVTGLTALATMGFFGALVVMVSTRLSRSDAERGRAQAATGDALTRYRAMLEATPDPTVVVDAAGLIAHANRRADESFGYEPGELEGLPVEQLLPERFRGVHLSHRETFAANPHSRPMGSGRELFARRKDGSELPVEISLSPVQTDGGPALVIASIRDVTERKTTEASLREAAHYFEVSHDLLCTASLDGRFQQLNGAWATTLGWSTAELSSRPFLEFVHPDDVQSTLSEFTRLVEDGATVAFVNRYRTKGGGWRWLEWNSTNVPSEQLIYASARDITARMLAEEARRQAEVQFTQAFEEAPIGMALTGLDGSFLSVNPALCELTGHAAEELYATDLQSITHPGDVSAELEARRRMLVGDSGRHHAERRFVSSRGEAIPVDVSMTLVCARDGEPSHFVSLVVDMSERKRFEGRLQYLAEHDPLTGLFNRRRFESELTRELALAARYANRGALLALDLDHFKYVNDSLGHAVGDELITRIGAAMKSRLRETDVLARLGGDEFAVVLPRVDEREALLVAEQLLAAIRQDGQVEGGNRVSASIGVAMFSEPGKVTADELMIEADIAMYDAKEAGRDRVALFNGGTGRQERMRARLTWADRIRSALEHDGFVLHAQPILGLNGDPVPRYELLIRMLGENGDLIPPGTFLYIAERFDMIQEIDRWVITEAIRLLAEQQHAGRDVRFEMNLSAKSVSDPDLVDVIAAQLRASGADPRGLCFEITETAAIVNVERAKVFARRLRQLGCTFALDDFGAGFASFYYLKHLEFDYLKIDGEFIQDLAESPINQLVVKSLVRIAKGLGKHTIAEFVTDEETLALVRSYGVSYAQGFYLARPGPITCNLPGQPSGLPQLQLH